MEKTFTICMTYWNRKNQLQNTLRSIEKYWHNVRIIIIDDCSTDGEDIHCFETDTISVIRLENKTWVNPCIPFNIAFSLVTSDIVIIQNAECMHMGDIIGHVLANIHPGLYLTYSAFSIDRENTDRVSLGEDPASVVAPFIRIARGEAQWCKNGWYNHPKQRPSSYHFCAAIMRSDLYELGGFDERYAKGSGWDDNEFLHRIRVKGLEVRIIEKPYVVHQWHNAFNAGNIPNMMRINYDKFMITQKTPEYDVKKTNTIYK